MLIQKKQERDAARYKGLAVRTIIQVIWLGISAIVAYFFIQYLFAEEIISFELLYSRLLIPNWVPEWAVTGGLIVFIVLFMQFFFILGYFIFSPLGRIRPANPTLRKGVVDPLEDNQYQRR